MYLCEGLIRNLRFITRIKKLNISHNDPPQLIDDEAGKTLVSASDQGTSAGNKTDRAAQVGGEIAALAKAKGIDSVVFDRGGYRFIGRVKALAEGAREGGLQF